MTELSFLIKLLLLEELPKPIKEMVAERIKEVEMTLVSKPHVPQPVISNRAPMAASQPSYMPPIPEHMLPMENIAQTPAAAAAIASRSKAIQDAIEGKMNKATGKPKKW